MKFLSKSTEETKIFARKIAAKLSGGETLCLYGDLGAGKTAFVSAVINFFLPGKRVLSPTFIIVRHYTIPHFRIKNFYHVDLYRISEEDEVQNLELFDYIKNSDTIVAVEWAEKLGSLKPKKRIDIKFLIKGKNQRIVKIDEKWIE